MDFHFPHTKVALEEYDMGQPKRQRLYDAAGTDEEVRTWETREKEDLDKVRRAFFEDTKHHNSLDNCMIVDLKFLRKMTQCT